MQQTEPLIDSHCHLDFDAFSDNREQVLEQCRLKGIKSLINPSVNPLENNTLIQLTDENPEIFFASGLHPWWQQAFIKQHGNQAQVRLTSAIEQQSKHPKCIGIGECGLDNCIELPVTEQLPLFKTQLQLASDLQLPLIIHARKVHNTLIKLLKQYTLTAGGVIHGFSGSPQQAREFWKLGFHIGVGGTITYSRAQKTRKAIQQLPLQALLLETDAPAMPVASHQGQHNSPLYLPAIASSLAELRDENLARIYQQTTENCYHLFPRLSSSNRPA